MRGGVPQEGVYRSKGHWRHKLRPCSFHYDAEKRQGKLAETFQGKERKEEKPAPS